MYIYNQLFNKLYLKYLVYRTCKINFQFSYVYSATYSFSKSRLFYIDIFSSSKLSFKLLKIFSIFESSETPKN